MVNGYSFLKFLRFNLSFCFDKIILSKVSVLYYCVLLYSCLNNLRVFSSNNLNNLYVFFNYQLIPCSILNSVNFSFIKRFEIFFSIIFRPHLKWDFDVKTIIFVQILTKWFLFLNFDIRFLIFFCMYLLVVYYVYELFYIMYPNLNIKNYKLN